MSKLGYTWYPKDFISDPEVMMMSAEERSVYRDLIDLAMLNDNKITFSLLELERYTNAKKEVIEKVLEIKGKKHPKFWSIPSCQKRIDKANRNKENGAKGGRPKKPKQNPEDNPTETQDKRQIEIESKIETEKKYKRWAEESNFDVDKVLFQFNKAWDYYKELDWKDKNGTPVKNIYLKIKNNWFTDHTLFKKEGLVVKDNSPVN